MQKAREWREYAKRAREEKRDEEALKRKELAAFPVEDIVNELSPAIEKRCQAVSLTGQTKYSVLFGLEDILVGCEGSYNLRTYNEELKQRLRIYKNKQWIKRSLRRLSGQFAMKTFSVALRKLIKTN